MPPIVIVKLGEEVAVNIPEWPNFTGVSVVPLVISAMMELRESLEQVGLEGRFVFLAVERSLSDSRQDTEEIFTDTSS